VQPVIAQVKEGFAGFERSEMEAIISETLACSALAASPA
jgi:hypothetical protein